MTEKKTQPTPRKAPVAKGTGRGRQRPNGLWEWRVTLSDGQRYSFYGETRKEAQQKAAAKQKAIDAGHNAEDDKLTVSKYLDRWLANTARDRVRASTYDSYAGHVRLYLKPLIGKKHLRKLAPSDVNAMLARLVLAKKEGGVGVSATTANLVRATLRTALASAVKDRRVDFNAAGLADARSFKRGRITPLDDVQAAALIKACAKDRYGPLYQVAIATGLRQGELLALLWSENVDLDSGILRVTKTLTGAKNGLGWERTDPKTDGSVREIDLPQLAIAALEQQQVTCAELEQLAGALWRHKLLNPGYEKRGEQPRYATHSLDFVFPSRFGNPLDGSNVTHHLQVILEKAELPKQRFHDLRHCYASLQLAEGMTLFDVKENLGHSQISLTANTYGHLAKKRRQASAAAIDRALGHTPTHTPDTKERDETE